MAPKNCPAAKRPAVSSCQHTSIQIDPSHFADEVGYIRPGANQRAKAQGIKPEDFKDEPFTFPAPLVLSDDDLHLDPKHPGQSVLAWTRLKERNPVTSRRRTIYIASSPEFDDQIAFGETWATPFNGTTNSQENVPSPDIELVAEYIRAFYHPLPVTVLPASTFRFVPWSKADQSKLKSKDVSSSSKTALVGLQAPSEVIGIRTRPTRQNDFPRQLNLDDLLDAAIASLPDDAYALLMLVDQDLYEDEDDEFVCGRAYGGSRVAVVSSARYNPLLDEGVGLDLDHVWPLSHCKGFVDGAQHKTAKTGKRRRKVPDVSGPGFGDNDDAERCRSTPLRSAINTVTHFRTTMIEESHSCRWLGRLLRTASHELGHCFGIGHCVYYACVMQGSASIMEDHRQPPYLCPVDLGKVLKACGTTELEHLVALSGFCGKYAGTVGGRSEMLAALEAWLRARLEQLA